MSIEIETVDRVGVEGDPVRIGQLIANLLDNGSKVFANMPQTNKIAVIDRKSHKLLENWDVKGAEQNVPMALDEPNYRLFVGCRKGAKMLVLDSESGKSIAVLPGDSNADDMSFDASRKRVYLSGGGGFVYVYQERSPDKYETLAKWLLPQEQKLRCSLQS
ncbi:MAG: YncE family protein [Bryobacteraceae bacterium]